MQTHVAWSIEGPHETCECGGSVRLIIARMWAIDSEDLDDEEPEDTETLEDVTAHQCRKCGRLTSLCLNVSR